MSDHYFLLRNICSMGSVLNHILKAELNFSSFHYVLANFSVKRFFLPQISMNDNHEKVRQFED
jgi:hypothetical protein